MAVCLAIMELLDNVKLKGREGKEVKPTTSQLVIELGKSLMAMLKQHEDLTGQD